ncbi:DUF1761 domain-containing protein [Candidatus Woesearchaeota archaeon]|nr:DUF1761 domain-containing protein [Candidatus Woesearchaeota archaeon]
MTGILILIGTTILVFIIGAMWYTPLLFGKTWMKLVGIKHRDMEKANMKNMMGQMVTAFIMNFIMVLVVWVLAKLLELNTFLDGMTLGLFLWVGLIMTTMINPVLWEKKPLKLFFINAGMYLVTIPLATGLVAALF